MISYRPKASTHHIERRRLLDSLPDDLGYAVWLEAPFGYGKSILASQWANRLEQNGWRVLWTSVQGRAPKPLLAQELGLPASAPWGVLLEALWGVPTLVVIEELESLDDHEGLAPLLADLGGLVLLASHGPLTCSELSRLQAAGRLVHLGGEALLFSEQEAETLFGGDERAGDVWRRTHGWPLPLHFALLTGELPERTGLLQGMRTSLTGPEWDEALLLATVALLPTTAARTATESLARSGFAQLTEGGFKLHSLVGEAILRSHGEAAREVLDREKERLALVERAEAFERCGHLTGLAEVLEDVTEQLWRLAPESVLRWADLLDAPATPLRNLVVGAALKVLGRNEESAEKLQLALASHALTADEQLIALGELCWVQAATQPDSARETVQRGEALLDSADPERAGRFLTNTFIVDIMAARYEEAISKLERALQYFPQASQYRVGARINLALSRWDLTGEFDDRLSTQSETLSDVWRLYPSDAPGQCRDIAMLHGWLGHTEQKRAFMERARDGARLNPLVGLEAEAALACLEGNREPFVDLLRQAEAWGDPYTQEIITMHGIETFASDPVTARRFYERSSEQRGLAAAAYAVVLRDTGAPEQALALLDENLQTHPDRPRQLYLRAARYRVSRSREDLDEFLALTTAGPKLLPGFVPLTELPESEPELSLAYPLEEVAVSGWSEAAALREGELPDLELTVLGEFRVRLFGREVRLTDRLQQLTMLLTLGLGREQAAEAMWPEIGVEKQRNNLGVQLSALRKLVEPWGFRRYVLEDRLQHTRSDYAELKSALAAGRAERVLSLYMEPLAPSMVLEVVESERRQLRAAVVALLFGAAADSEAERSAAYLTRVLELEPLHEDALQRLLALLLDRGKRREARRRYLEFERRLNREMGLEPLDETRALLQAVG